MTVVVADALEQGAVLRADLCVVGTGPAALSLVAALRNRGLRICLAESGLERPDEKIQQLNDFSNVGLPIRKNFVNRLRMLGGASNLWPGRCMALEEIDFESRGWVPESGWPISHGEYCEFLAAAAEILGLPGELAAKVSGASQDISSKADSLTHDQDVIAEKTAIWAKTPARFWDLHRDEMARSDRIQVISGLTITSLSLDEAGSRVTRMVGTSQSGRAVDIHAECFVLAMGGLENARMLLLGLRQNPQARYPKDLVGRYYMDHPRAVCGRVRLAPGVDLSAQIGLPVAGGMLQAGFGLSPSEQRRGRWLNGYLYFETASSEIAHRGYETAAYVFKQVTKKAHAGRRWNLLDLASARDLIYELTPREVLPHDLYRVYVKARSFIKTHKRDIVIINHCEQVPDRDSRVTLGKDLDRFGNPLLDLDWRMNELEIETLVHLHRQLDERLKATKIGQITSDPNDLRTANFLDASHHMGTTRMSEAASSGVVDRNLKVHDMDNLYVCGSSVFPTSGSANPTWSIVALSLRLGAHLAARLKAARSGSP